MRAAHSLAAHPSIESLVVLGPGPSRFYQVVEDPGECDFLIVTGPDGPERYSDSGVPMIWDGDHHEAGVSVWAASPAGLAVALAQREGGSAALAHPQLGEARDEKIRFPEPVGTVGVTEVAVNGRSLMGGRSATEYTAVLASGASRRVAIVDEAAFLDGIALAAGVMVAGDEPRPVWADALGYLTAAAEMGLVMAEDSLLPS